MSSIKAVLRKKPNKQGLYPITIRITKDRKTTFLYTGQYLDEKFWDNANFKVKKSHPNSVRLNNRIASKLADANDILLESEKDNEKTSVKTIKKQLIKSTGLDFFAVAKMHHENTEKRKKFNQVQSDKGRIKIFKEFLKQDEISFLEIDVQLLRKFENHLLHTKKRTPRTVVNYFILIRTIYNLAVSHAIVDKRNYPFGKGKIQIRIPESKKVGLSRKEIQLLENVENLSEAQQHALNIWLTSFYFAGVRVGDVLKLRWNDFKDGRLYYRMGKNEKLVSLKIPAKAQNILNLYKRNDSKTIDLVFPELQEVNFKDLKRLQIRIKTITRNLNRRLEMVAEKVEIDKKMTMHIARHSFGNISGDSIPIQTLQKLYRHSSITTTINYQQNFMHKEIDEALDKVIN
ncbi:phage integrase SAM-like domain-containing protein [Kordia sp.]|uniref:phage integrase SAM-like domain-containing protein n=1 Tax=Kordia sp. TaxID=1965332 RepID=UPI003D6B17B6